MATIYETIQELGSIVTSAITAGTSENVPSRLIRTTLLKVSTGKYKEVLPIVVPAECCILGDELRSTNVQPRTVYNSASTLTPTGDFKYTSVSLQRLEDIIDEIVTGQAVTPTTGNSQTQDQTWPYAETTTVAPAAQKLARNIRRRIDVSLGNKLEGDLPKAYAMTTPATVYGYHRDVLSENKEFIVSEVTGYLNTNYPDLKYSRTKCKQDVGFILDALAYDLSYGGNWQTINAGEAYFEGTNLNIDSSELAATKAAYTYLRDLVSVVGRGIAVSPVLNSDDKTQILNPGFLGNVTTANFAVARIDDILNILENGSGTVAITYPSIVSADAELITVYNNLIDNMDVIGEQTIDFIAKNFGTFKYDASKCRRDLRKIITDTSYDVAMGTNFNAVYTGLSYMRGNAYTVVNGQKTETIGAIRNARDELKISVTTDGSSAVGGSNSSTRITSAFNEITNTINFGTPSYSYPGDGTVSAITFPNPSVLPTANADDAKDNLIANRTFIQEEVVAWIADQIAANAGNSGSIWYQFTYNTSKCKRDVGYIVDALTYDVLYGGNQATLRVSESYFADDGTIQIYGQEDQTVAAYARLATVVDQVVREVSVTKSSGNAEVQTQLGAAATATEGNYVDGLVQVIEDVLTAGNLNSLPAITYPSITWADAEYETAFSDIASDREDVIRSTVQYITNTYTGFVYDHAKCTRDLTLIATAAGYDWMLGTNYASIIAAYSYLRQPSAKVVGDQKTATIAANEFARQKAVTYLSANATAIAGLNNTWQWVEDTIFAGMPEGGNDAVADQEVYNAIRQLELNKEFIVDECVAYVNDYYKTIAEATNVTNDTIVVSDTSWLSVGLPIKFTNGDDSSNVVDEAGLLPDTTYYVSEIKNATEFQISDSLYGPLQTINDYGEGFTIEKAYQYNVDLCKRDLREYIDGIKVDMTYPQMWKREYTDDVTIYMPGINQTRLGARYYANSVLGSQEEDMFYLRNGTGLRMMTVDGLRGDLTPANAYGTSRVTAGAYASLDPGWGPNDERVWITARSPYVQNLTTFGYAAIGQKIDGALHNGGNDSIVSNDFTQVISDGIGAWITNNGRAELVSVFSYYSHIGYLAEAGGRIRATNGNNSYGTFGSVAEGVDPDETEITAIVDNKFQYNAVISQVFTDQADEILAVEYSHAGNQYTQAKLNFFGPGDNEDTINDEQRDQAVNTVRILEVDDSTGNPDATAGGSGYLTVSNTAQTGDATSITLAATDGNLSTAYPGMKVYVIAGAGAGLYGVIDTYNAGTKVATVNKESDGTAGWDHVIPGKSVSNPNSSSTYFIEPRIEFTAPAKSDTNHTITSTLHSAVEYLETSEIYTNVTTTSQSDGIAATFDVTRSGSKYTATLNAAGTGYVRLDTLTILGSAVGGADGTNDITITATAVDASTGAITGFDYEGVGRKGLFLAISAAQPNHQYSYDGQTWAAGTFDTSASWQNIANGLVDDGSTAFLLSQSVAVGVTGGNTVVNISSDGLTWEAPAAQPSIASLGDADIAYGQIAVNVGRMIVIADNDRDVAYSDNGGETWLIQTDGLPSTGYTTVTFGAGKFVAIKNGSQEAAYSTDGITWTQTLVALPAASGWCDIEFGNNRFVAVADDTTNIAYSFDGITWTAVAGALVGTKANRIAYGQGMFVVTTDDTNQLSYSEYGTYWPAGGHTLSNSYTNGLSAIAFGNPDEEPKFVAIQDGVGGTNVANAKIGATAKGRAGVASEKVFEVRLLDPGSAYGSTEPDITITDPNNIDDVLTQVRLGNGVLSQPTYVNRGSGFISATAEINTDESNGYADFYQSGQFVAVRQLSAVPVNGSNIVFDSLPGQVFKLVNVISRLGTIDGTYTAFLQTSPNMEIEDSPEHADPVTLRIRFSQVRLTGHDFLDIGTGNFDDTNYPNEVYGPPVNDPDQNNETVESNGGRVFYTATDQDGNFRVGDLFSIEQATGVATLNAEAFNIAGLQELTLGEVTLGGNSASVTEFSTDPFFTANSDTVVPTQRAIKAYIEAQIGGGQASLIVNSITAGDIFIAGTQITTVTGAPINIKANVNFQGTVVGLPIAYNYYFR